MLRAGKAPKMDFCRRKRAEMGDAITYFFTQGILGVIVVVLALVVVKLYNENKALQEARRLDAEKNLRETHEIIGGVSTNMRILTEKIEVGKKTGRNQ